MIMKGILDCLHILAFAIPAGIAIGYAVDPETGSIWGFVLFLAGVIYQGTKYYKKYGPLLYAEDGNALKRLFQYSLGYGLLVGSPLIFINMYLGESINLIASLVLSIIAIPLFGMKMMGALGLGRMLNRNLDE